MTNDTIQREIERLLRDIQDDERRVITAEREFIRYESPKDQLKIQMYIGSMERKRKLLETLLQGERA